MTAQRSIIMAATIASCGLIGSTARAVSPRDRARARPAFELASGAPVRLERDARGDRMPARLARPWRALRADTGGTWLAQWDTATGVPSRIYGSGLIAPGAVVDAAIARDHAERFLARHI